MKSWQALAMITVIWAGLYLPYLGSVEIRGEEARRILPGRTMMETGEWIVPSIGGEVYNRKPPLINWTIAGSFALTGLQNEWTARLPSVLWLLAFAIIAFLLLEKPLGTWRAACVPLFFLSTLGMLDKGRMAEIEAMFIAQFGIAYIVWAVWWSQGRVWAAYLVSGLVLGLATLAKGPVHLMFWYPILGFALWRAQALKELIRPAHLLGLALMFAVFLPWALLNMQQVDEPSESSGVWIEQLLSRIRYTDIDYASWLEHPFQMVANFLPWSILLILAWWRVTPTLKTVPRSDRWVAVIRGSQFGILLGMGVLLLTPEGLPRYSMPLFTPAALVLVVLWSRLEEANPVRLGLRTPSPEMPLPNRVIRGLGVFLNSLTVPQVEQAWRVANLGFIGVTFVSVIVGAIVAKALGYPISPPLILIALVALGAGGFRLWQLRRRLPLLYGSCVVMALALVGFHSVAVPLKASREKFRPAGQELVAATADLEKPLVIYDPGHLRFLFYVDRPYVEIAHSSKLPRHSGYLVVRPKHFERSSVRRYLDGFERQEIGRWTWEEKEFVVLDLTLKPS